MKQRIRENLNKPEQLEKLYLSNKSTFKQEFNGLYPEIQDQPIAQFWNLRLNFEKGKISWGNLSEIFYLVLGSFLSWLYIRFPEFVPVQKDIFYLKNLGLFITPSLIVYFAWRQKISLRDWFLICFAILFAFLFMYHLPNFPESKTTILACIHLPLFLWTVLGYSFAGGHSNDYRKNLDFLKFTEDLSLIAGILSILGLCLAGLTSVLFSLIKIEVEFFLFEYVFLWGLVAVPLVGTHLLQTNPDLIQKVTPIVTKLFTPIFFTILLIYFFAILTLAKNPYNDREFLLQFNLVLAIVMASILISISTYSRNSISKMETVLLFSLSLLAILLNGIALSSIFLRILDWGISPNRIAVLIWNMLFMSNLILVAFQFFQIFREKTNIQKIEKGISRFLKVYSFWIMFVTFIFPILFDFQ